ncbi:MAG: TolC family protein [Candidatus Eisenbacteria bacterium]
MNLIRSKISANGDSVINREVRMMGTVGRPIVLVCALVAGLLVGEAFAQETRRITLREAIDTALECNVSALQASDRVASSRVSVRQAATQFLPDLSASASGNGTGSSASSRLSSSLTLFDGLGDFNSLRAAQLGLQADRRSYERTQQTVIFQTVSGFMDVLMNRELVQSRQENLEAQRQQLALVREFYKVGNRPLADLLQQQAAVAQAELQVLNAEQTEGVSKLQLLKTLGVEPTADYEAVALQLDQLIPKFEAPDPDPTLREALAHRADVAGQKAQVEATAKQVSVARSGYWPSLSIGLSGGSSYSENRSGSFSHQMWGTSPAFDIGLSLSLPLFDRLRTRSSIQQADITLRNQKLTLEDLERQVTLDIRQALLDYETAVKRLRAADAQLEYTQQALAATTERYRVGAATLAELAASRAQYANARTDRVQAGYTVVIAWLAIGYYRGDIDVALRMLG